MFAKQKESSENAFLITKLDQKYIEEILRVRSCLPYLKVLALSLKRGEKQYLAGENYFKMEEILSELCYFLFDKSKPAIDINLKLLKEEPVVRRQQILREMKIIDILVDILYFPFKSNLFTLTQLTSLDPMTNMLANVYTTIRFTIQEYRPNELYASQWLELFMDQAIRTNKSNDIQASRTLTELIDNNKRILESRIEKSVINQFINYLATHDRDTKTVNILRAICICDGKPMIKNQKDVSLQILGNPKIYKELIFPIRRMGNKIEVQAIDLGGKWNCLDSYKTTDEDNKQMKSYKFFVSMINLCADLCMDRNYIAIDVLVRIYPLDCCIEILRSEDYPMEMRSAICRLIDYVWVQVYPFEHIRLPEFSKTLIDANEVNEPSIACSTEDTSRFEILKKYCQDYLERTFGADFSYAHEVVDKTKLSLSILHLIE